MNIDLLGTRQELTPETRACVGLLTAVILRAIEDADAPTNATERKLARNGQPWNVDRDARAALDWLFSPAPEFVAYTRMLGMDHGRIISALITPIEPATGIAAQTRQMLRVRYAWWSTERHLLAPARRVVHDKRRRERSRFVMR